MTIKPLTSEAIGRLAAQSWLVPGKEDCFRGALDTRDFKTAIECCRKHLVDDLVYGEVDSATRAETTGLTPRLDAFAALSDYMTDEEYFSILGFVWVEVDRKRITPGQATALFRPTNRDPSTYHLVMDPDEREKYSALTARFDVFRGCTRDTADNCSWTLDRSRAMAFVQDFASQVEDSLSDDDQTPVVIRGTCEKHHVWAVFTRWGEEEVVVDPFRITDRQEIQP